MVSLSIRWKELGISREEVLNVLPALGIEIKGMIEDRIELELSPNRQDFFSIEGISRAVDSFTSKKKGLIRYKCAGDSGIVINVKKTTRPFIRAAVVKRLNCDLGELIKFQERLDHGTGYRRISAAIGLHSLNKINPPISYTSTTSKTKFIPLGWSREASIEEILKEHEKGKEYAHLMKHGYPILMDSKSNVLSLPPVINSGLTVLSKDTKELFVDITGTNEYSVNYCLNILTTALIDQGSKVYSVKVQDGRPRISPNFDTKTTEVELEKINRILGCKLSREKAVDCLERMGHSVEIDMADGKLIVESPCYRSDMIGERDVIEDIAIAYGYWNIKPVLPAQQTIGRPINKQRGEKMRELFIGFGFTEVITPILSSGDGWRIIKNPLPNAETLRTSLIPGFLRVFERNKHKILPQSIFEIGEVLEPESKKNVKVAGCAIISENANFSRMKSICLEMFRALEIDIALTECELKIYLKGRGADININIDTDIDINTDSTRSIGNFGEIHPEVILANNLEHPITTMEMKI